MDGSAALPSPPARRNDCRPCGVTVLVLVVGLVVGSVTTVAAAAKKPKQPNPAVAKYREALASDSMDDALSDLLDRIRSPKATHELDALATVLVARKGKAASLSKSLVKNHHPDAATAAAELLWRMAVKKGLDDDLASLAAGMLGHDDPFVRALAEWAISTRVEIDSKGQKIVWPVSRSAAVVLPLEGPVTPRSAGGRLRPHGDCLGHPP